MVEASEVSVQTNIQECGDNIALNIKNLLCFQYYF